MTGFAARRGEGGGAVWAWDLRSVNGKGFDLRLRVPDWIEGLEMALRTALGAVIARGNVSLSLKLTRAAAEDSVRLNAGALQAVLVALHGVEDAALAADLRLAPTTAADILGLRGVLESGGVEEDSAPVLAALLADLPALIAEFQAMRASEGAALAGIVTAQIDRIAALTLEARGLAEARRDAVAQGLRDSLAKILGMTDAADPVRLAQELALLAVKADVTEELDRLAAHIAAARSLLAEPGPIGRKIDFLMQEFNREANTLCSKAGSTGLTRVGLDLKVVIDQMREQVQNVE